MKFSAYISLYALLVQSSCVQTDNIDLYEL